MRRNDVFTANFHHPATQLRTQPPAVANPSVVIIGDSIVNAWCSAALLAQNPTWACQGSPAGVRGETTAQVLARFAKAIGASPKTIGIEAGIWDIEEFALAEPLEYTGEGPNPCIDNNPAYPPPSPTPCANIQQMITEATNAGISVIVCTIPPWGQGPAATNPSGLEMINHDGDIIDFNRVIMSMAAPAQGSQPAVATVDMYKALETFPPGDDAYVYYYYVYYPTYTDDGVNPNSAGGQVMTQAL
jgi:lysophospholipase L1-like esterase